MSGIDVYGLALQDYANEEEDKFWVNTSYGEPEEMPTWYFFREYDEMPALEKMAMTICEGRTLDVGAGTGSHSLCLQQMKFDVVAIDTSEVAVKIMRESKVRDARSIDFFDLEGEKFDTMLCLMNGLGFIGKLNRLKEFLEKAEDLLNEDGQILLDSSDVAYLYTDTEKPQDHYYGEVSFQYQYKGQKGDWFDWVYVDKETLSEKCQELGWNVQVLTEDENGQYLARITRISK